MIISHNMYFIVFAFVYVFIYLLNWCLALYFRIFHFCTGGHHGGMKAGTGGGNTKSSAICSEKTSSGIHGVTFLVTVLLV